MGSLFPFDSQLDSQRFWTPSVAAGQARTERYTTVAPPTRTHRYWHSPLRKNGPHLGPLLKTSFVNLLLLLTLRGEYAIERSGGCLRPPWHDMAVGVHGQADLAVPQNLHDRSWVYPL